MCTRAGVEGPQETQDQLGIDLDCRKESGQRSRAAVMGVGLALRWSEHLPPGRHILPCAEVGQGRHQLPSLFLSPVFWGHLCVPTSHRCPAPLGEHDRRGSGHIHGRGAVWNPLPRPRVAPAFALVHPLRAHSHDGEQMWAPPLGPRPRAWHCRAVLGVPCVFGQAWLLHVKSVLLLTRLVWLPALSGFGVCLWPSDSPASALPVFPPSRLPTTVAAKIWASMACSAGLSWSIGVGSE